MMEVRGRNRQSRNSPSHSGHGFDVVMLGESIGGPASSVGDAATGRNPRLDLAQAFFGSLAEPIPDATKPVAAMRGTINAPFGKPGRVPQRSRAKMPRESETESLSRPCARRDETLGADHAEPGRRSSDDLPATDPNPFPRMQIRFRSRAMGDSRIPATTPAGNPDSARRR